MSTRMTVAEMREETAPPRRGKKSITPSEQDIQATLMQALKQCGYIVLTTGSQRAGLVGQIYAGLCQAGMLHHSLSKQAIYTVLNRAIRGFSENDTGTPDIFVSHPDWPSGEWLGLELKTPTGKVRPEQQRLADLGRVVIVRGVAEGLRVVRDREEKQARASVVAWTLTTHYKITQMVEQFAGTAGNCISAAILGGE